MFSLSKDFNKIFKHCYKSSVVFMFIRIKIYFVNNKVNKYSVVKKITFEADTLFIFEA